MAIDYNSGISSLQTGAPDIKYTGDQGPRSPDQQLMASADPMLVDEYKKYVFELKEIRPEATPMSFREFVQQVMSGMAYGGTAKPTYTQSRKQRMAYGGVAGLDGRKRYGIGSWFQENIKDPIEKAVRGLPDEYYPEGHPQAGQKKPAHEHSVIKGESQARVDREEAGLPEGESYTPWYEQIFSPDIQQLTDQTALNFGLGDLAQNIGLGDITRLFGLENEQTGRLPLGADWLGIAPDSSLNPYLRRLTKEGVAAVPAQPERWVGPAEKGAPQIYVPPVPAQQAQAPE